MRKKEKENKIVKYLYNSNNKTILKRAIYTTTTTKKLTTKV